MKEVFIAENQEVRLKEVGVNYYPELRKSIGIWTGHGWDKNQINLTPVDVLNSKWRNEIVRAGAAWFIPLLEKMRDGEVVSVKDIEHARMASPEGK